MPNDDTNLLEVPGNRLPETGSRQMKILHIRGAWLLGKIFSKSQPARKSDQPGRIKSQQYCEVVLKQLRSQRPRNHQGRISAQTFQPWPKDQIHEGILIASEYSSISLIKRVSARRQKYSQSQRLETQAH
ncbi:hypothetical protein GQ457_03G025230 [Hibiscus cannabinus]